MGDPPYAWSLVRSALKVALSFSFCTAFSARMSLVVLSLSLYRFMSELMIRLVNQNCAALLSRTLGSATCTNPTVCSLRAQMKERKKREKEIRRSNAMA